ncbi:MAG: glycoside hydrolase family 99-like domain-containing protein [Bacteroidales bacterium]
MFINAIFYIKRTVKGILEKRFPALLGPAKRCYKLLQDLKVILKKLFRSVLAGMGNTLALNQPKIFDSHWYLNQNPDIRLAGIDAWTHYCNYGWKEFRNPNPFFDVKYYLQTYFNKSNHHQEPLSHYLRKGWKEGNLPSPRFDVLYYLNDCHETRKSETNPLVHFIQTVLNGGSYRFIDNKKDNFLKLLNVTPLYLDPFINPENDLLQGNTLAIHINLDGLDRVPEYIDYLKKIPVTFDLFISLGEETGGESILSIFSSHVENISKIEFNKSQNRIGKLGSLLSYDLEQFMEYSFIHHIDLSNSPSGLNTATTNTLQYSVEEIKQILNLLLKGVKLIYTEDCNVPSNLTSLPVEEINHFLKISGLLSFSSYDLIEFPCTSFLWFSSQAVNSLSTIKSELKEIPDHKLQPELFVRLFFMAAASDKRNGIRIVRGDSICNFRYYEEQQDFSSSIKEKNVKVLAYYLPQFNPIPENDAWHGEGFTEWTKVRTAQPLFMGHYQQHIPHPDIGYYLLDNPDVLRQQAEMMRKSGIYGQVFYHYWFTGKLILEKPAQMLLENQDIKMPFCFCWANENWTKRWDGDENEILLKQDYSENDAAEFIRYLIPFFKDARYIRIENRPVLMIYRASSFPDFLVYRSVWERECSQNGILNPYLVTVLTRGASNPGSYQMDAGVERVLHDWTHGKVPNLRDILHPFVPLNANILDYHAVVKFYSKQHHKKQFTYFRSLVPIWDNTARYAADAYVVHESNPELFQQWLQECCEYTKNELSADRQFIMINAWNEWAEGAHLEPDTRFGYGYLNSVGRVLSGITYKEYFNREAGELSNNLKIKLRFHPDFFKGFIPGDPRSQKMMDCLANSSVFHQCEVTLEESIVADTLKDKNVPFNLKPENDCIYTIEIRRLAYFSGTMLENLVRKCNFFRDCIVVPNCFFDREPVITPDFGTNFSVDNSGHYGIKIIPSKGKGYKVIKIVPDELCVFPDPDREVKNSGEDYPVVTSIIRVHPKADFRLLKNALLSLYSQEDCFVRPWLAVQDFSDNLLSKLLSIINEFSWPENSKPEIRHFWTGGNQTDCRSTMLNESLKSAGTRFVTFLDYDDYLFPHAYYWLLKRLYKTGKAVAFGSVYKTLFEKESIKVTARLKSFEYGVDYSDYLRMNHSPIHGFMMDTHQFETNMITYFEDMRYMEDYYMTMQIFTKNNCDWEGLLSRHYIGDYMHCIDSQQTLAFTDEKQRIALLKDPEYLICEDRINAMRLKLNRIK